MEETRGEMAQKPGGAFEVRLGRDVPEFSGSDITVIRQCLQLSNYGQFGSVTYSEITVIWVHL